MEFWRYKRALFRIKFMLIISAGKKGWLLGGDYSTFISIMSAWEIYFPEETDYLILSAGLSGFFLHSIRFSHSFSLFFPLAGILSSILFLKC